MNTHCSGYFTTLQNKQFYKIENYDDMEDFFMTITSASDVWNFCWSQGGITAGRIDCDHAIFPYYTADKVSDAKSYTGSYTAIAVEQAGKTFLWEPFTPLSNSPAARIESSKKIKRNIYKNTTGTMLIFEEINKELELSFQYGWTSSSRFGLVRTAKITNLSSKERNVTILDGCRNILPACVSADFQNNNSVLLDAYKKTDLDISSNLALFAVSSIVTDKAEPSEGLYANTCWFSTDDPIILSPDAPSLFAKGEKLQQEMVIKGKRPSCFICRKCVLTAPLDSKNSDSWYQIFDTSLDACKIALLKKEIQNRKEAQQALEKDIDDGELCIEKYISSADGIQHTAVETVCAHHCENVMFNIMRGGLFANNGNILPSDFLSFVSQRNKSLVKDATSIVSQLLPKDSQANQQLLTYTQLRTAFEKKGTPQLRRIFFEYLPLTFSRRHGDPSRPWNRFNIKLHDENGNAILNYEGNWRDIFQNWEALAYSYPEYTKNMYSVFLNAMTVDGFNPYHISRSGIDWEIPDPENPWAQIGYWGDHQVIYLQKLLELYSKTDRASLLASLNEKQYTSSNVPYRLKPYSDIVKNPRNTILFDRQLSTKLEEDAKRKGSDAKLVCDTDGQPELISLSAKLLQIVITKIANFVPGGGIWLNTQRPEWNDANNALAGYGLSMVTLYYFYRYLSFLITLFNETSENTILLPGEIASCFTKIGELCEESSPSTTASDPHLRKIFTDKAGILFEVERNGLYTQGYSQPEVQLSSAKITQILSAIKNQVEHTIKLNKRKDGLYHAYNTMRITNNTFELEYLQEMLEGQVAVLSSGILSPDESLAVLNALKQSAMFEKRQHSYMLYPNKELPLFFNKNCVPGKDITSLAAIVSRTGKKILAKDCNNVYHFNPNFRNVRIMEEYFSTLPKEEQPSSTEHKELCDLYERTFTHQSFTGRSGTFYAYEGLGSIYWHMVSKLLLAVQENIYTALEAVRQKTCSLSTAKLLADSYYDIRNGIGFNKTPDLYGAFPCDPYSHTPSGQGAKQPGMTGQVKEEILTRWGELGVTCTNGIASFIPVLLEKKEFIDDGTLNFSWCGTPIIYHLVENTNDECITIHSDSDIKRKGNSLSSEETKQLFNREGIISSIEVWTARTGSLVE